MKTIYAIPALATNAEIFKFLDLKNAQLKVLDWPILSKGDTMQSYAKKFTDQIDASRPFSLLGVSLGGMLCAELTEYLKPDKTILISSCKCASEIPEGIKVFNKFPLHHYLSENALREMAVNSRLLLGFEETYLPDFKRMVYSMQSDYFKNTIEMVVNWSNKKCKRKNCIHIHGDDDRLLLYNKVIADYTIKGGTHAMVVNNANELSVILNTIL